MICNHSALCSDVWLRMTGSVAHGARRSDGAAGHGCSPFYSIIKLNAGPGGTAIFPSHLYFRPEMSHTKHRGGKGLILVIQSYSHLKLLLVHIVTCRLVCFIVGEECIDMEVILNLISVCAHVHVCVRVVVYTTNWVPKSAFYEQSLNLRI